VKKIVSHIYNNFDSFKLASKTTRMSLGLVENSVEKVWYNLIIVRVLC
jgi:hypothetical protein